MAEGDLQVGEEVRLAYHTRSPWWTNRAFTIRRTSDEIVLAGLKASELPGEQYGAPIGFFDPIRVELLVTCPFEPVEDNTGRNFLDSGPCYSVRRDTIRLTWSEGASLDVIDRGAAPWPDEPYMVVVRSAETYESLGSCTDVPNRHVGVILLRTTSP